MPLNVLGVHIRRNEAVRSRIGNRYTKPTDDQFRTAIDRHLALGSAHVVFFATDDPAVYRDFHETYGDAPRFRSHPWNRYPQRLDAPKHGQRKALVDLWTLRCCDRVMATDFSVFGELAKMPVDRHMYNTWAAARAGDGIADRAPTIEEFDDEAEPPQLVRARAHATQAIAAALVLSELATAAVRLAVTAAEEALPAALKQADDARQVLAELANAAVRQAVAAVDAVADARKREVAQVLGRMLVRKRAMVGVVARAVDGCAS